MIRVRVYRYNTVPVRCTYALGVVTQLTERTESVSKTLMSAKNRRPSLGAAPRSTAVIRMRQQPLLLQRSLALCTWRVAPLRVR